MLHLHVRMGIEKPSEPAPDFFDALLKALPAVSAIVGPLVSLFPSEKKKCPGCSGEAHSAPMGPSTGEPHGVCIGELYGVASIASAAKRAGFGAEDIDALFVKLNTPEGNPLDHDQKR